MVDKANNESVEVAAFGVQTATGKQYYVQPWEYNTAIESFNNYDIPGGYGRKDVFAQYHTHSNSLGPSRKDAVYSQTWVLPVYTIGADGHIWITDLYPRGYAIPRHLETNPYVPYGKLLR